MAAVKIKYNVAGADHKANAEGGAGEQAPKGVYVAELDQANLGFSKDDDGKPDKSRPRIECVWRIIGLADGSKPDKNYSPVWDYVSFSDAAEWKLDQFLQSIGVDTESDEEGELDLTKYAAKATNLKGEEQKGKKGTPVKVKIRVVSGKNLEGDYRAKIGGTYRLTDEDEEALDEALEAAAEEEPGDEPEWEDEDEDVLTADDIDEMPAAELKELVKENKIKVKKGMKVKDVRELVKEELGLNDEDEDGDADELPF